MIYYKNNSSISLHVNGKHFNIVVQPRDTLLDVLRRDLGLSGAKPGCLQGNCGACTVLVNGEPMKSCLMLAVEAIGHKITTIEGLENSVVQDSFVKHLAFQCGYCTSGFIMNIVGLFNKYSHPKEEEIKEWMQSNICRCTSYEELREAIHDVEQNICSEKPHG